MQSVPLEDKTYNCLKGVPTKLRFPRGGPQKYTYTYLYVRSPAVVLQGSRFFFFFPLHLILRE